MFYSYPKMISWAPISGALTSEKSNNLHLSYATNSKPVMCGLPPFVNTTGSLLKPPQVMVHPANCKKRKTPKKYILMKSTMQVKLVCSTSWCQTKQCPLKKKTVKVERKWSRLTVQCSNSTGTHKLKSLESQDALKTSKVFQFTTR